MPEQDTAKQIEERIAQLPVDVQEAVLASDFDEKVLAIGKSHNLHIDQSQLLGNEIYMVMLGMSDTADFVNSIEKEVRVSKEEAEKIATDVNAKILAPIRESLKRMYEQEGEAPAPTVPSSMPSTSQKSVVMPSSVAAAKAAVPQAPAMAVPAKPIPPVSVPVPAAPMPVPATPATPITSMMPKPPAATPDLRSAERVLTEKTVQVPVPTPPQVASSSTVPAKPGAYKADPYREPIE
ncbi:MAG TPA: hypothetical protein VHD55_02185 [Candidatus Paceibacterota bacterium]|nr:hypothetical protein [Candidatus Paceibacterota bacterium]